MSLVETRKQLGAWIKSTNAPTLVAHSITPRVWLACGNCLIGDSLTLTLTAQADYEGGYPLWLPKRLKSPTLSAPDNLDTLAADDFQPIRKLTLKQGETMEIKLAGETS